MFRNREEAGRILAKRIFRYKDQEDVLVFGITKGGVVVAKEVSKALNLPLYPLIVKKIGAPSNPELAIGAVAPYETIYWDEETLNTIKDKKEAEKALLEKKKEVSRLFSEFKFKKSDVFGKSIILVDDGVATGSTVIAASLLFKKLGAKKVILAVPVVAKETLPKIKGYFDEIIALETPLWFYAVVEFYEDFSEVSYDRIRELLKRDEEWYFNFKFDLRQVLLALLHSSLHSRKHHC
jgi:putative phosphoribosyl transferase